MTAWPRRWWSTRRSSRRAWPLGRRRSTNAAEAKTDTLASALQLTDLKGLGPASADRLAELGIHTPLDLLYHLPKGYLDRSNRTDIGALTAGQDVTVVGTLGPVRGGGRGRWRRAPVTSTVTDDTGDIAVAWFNQPYLAQTLERGQRVVCTGRVREYRGALQLTSPTVETVGNDEEDRAWQRLLPSYRTPDGLSDRKLRGWIAQLLDDLDTEIDPLPERVRAEFELPDWAEAMRRVHAPQEPAEHEAAQRRFAFEEFLLFQLRLQRARAAAGESGAARPLAAPQALHAFQAALPFALTGDQERVWREMQDRLGSSLPANLLLQGDVGTGKTLLALQAALLAIESGAQVALMAPTEILVDQHAATVRRWLAPHGIEWTTLTGGLRATDRRARREALAEGDLPLVIGTHALFDEGVRFDRLGLVIIDEQHRFGVLQRARLQQKGVAPHVIVMTATPIPRSLALTLYGEFDRLTLRERPAGRQPVVTELLGETPGTQWIDRVRAELDAGRQVYWVCPLVQESEDSTGRGTVEQLDRLRRGPLKGYALGLLHGGLDPAEKTDAMQAFTSGAVQVLVCTSVIEVGVDVPNASVMVIEDAHRFGLSQLHQLRGRLGRGGHAGLCLLRGTPTTEAGTARLEALARTTDGFEIAAEDLALRGPGEFLGVRQSGVPRLRYGHLVHQADLMEAAAGCARAVLAADPDLADPAHAGLRARLGEDGPAELWL